VSKDTIQRAKGLIQQQDIRLRSERSSERHALRLPSRELAGGAIQKTFQANQASKLLHPLITTTALGECETYVVANTQVREQ
jgi:hypothetical protein